MGATPTEDRLSPIDQIRQAEAEVTRRIAAARETSSQIVKDAQAKAAALREDAREAGQREGRMTYRERVSSAEEAAHVVVSQAQLRAEDLRQKGNQGMVAAVQRAIHIVIGRVEKEVPDDA